MSDALSVSLNIFSKFLMTSIIGQFYDFVGLALWQIIKPANNVCYCKTHIFNG